MRESGNPGIYLIVHFDWPQPIVPDLGQKAKALHDVVQGKSWIREVMAASGGIGGAQSSMWIFWLQNYGALDRLMKNRDDEVAQAYQTFFSGMTHVQDQIREEVLFIS